MADPLVPLLERASHTAVPAARSGFDGPFLVRAFLGGTGRTNAASSLSDAPAVALYEAMGLREVYRYRYYRPAAG